MGKSLKKYILMAVGSVSLFLGILGIFLPLLPTVPFLLLTAYCFARSSEKWHNWLLAHKTFGSYIANYQKYRAINKKAKRTAIATLWGSLGISMLCMSSSPYLIAMLISIGCGMTFYLYSMKTLKE